MNPSKNSELDAAYAVRYYFRAWPVAGGIFLAFVILGLFGVGPAKSLNPMLLLLIGTILVVVIVFTARVVNKAQRRIDKT
jgi:hypothetical protein